MAKARIIEQIAESNIKAIYITPYIVNDWLPVIQTVKKASRIRIYSKLLHIASKWYLVRWIRQERRKARAKQHAVQPTCDSAHEKSERRKY